MSTVVKQNSINKITAFSALGSLFEWYDLSIFAMATAIVFNKLFFTPLATSAGITAGLLTLYAGILAKPLGGIIFGHFGDKYGRRSTLVITLLLTSICTVGMGLLPTYNQIGIWAPIGLIVLRIVQSVSFGGEWSGAALMVYENAPPNRKSFYGSLIQASNPAGVLLASSTLAFIAATMSHEAFMSWGWRLPFVLSFLLGVFSFALRWSLSETPQFLKLQKEKKIIKIPFIELIKEPKKILIGIGLKLTPIAFGFISSVVIIGYLVNIKGIPRSEAWGYHAIGAFAHLLIVPFYGWIADKIGNRKLYLYGTVTAFVFAYPVLWLIQSGHEAIGWVLGEVFIHSMAGATISTVIPSVFKTNVRYSGSSLSFTAGAAVLGLVPLTGTWISTHYDLASCAVILMFFAPLSYWASRYIVDEKRTA